MADYLLAKDKLHTLLHDYVENAQQISRKAQLEGYDGCARLRPEWDEIASKYDAVFTASVVDEAPKGISNTGDAVRNPLPLPNTPISSIPRFTSISFVSSFFS